MDIPGAHPLFFDHEISPSKKGHVAHFPCILSIVDPMLGYYTRSDLGQLKLVHFNLQTSLQI